MKKLLVIALSLYLLVGCGEKVSLDNHTVLNNIVIPSPADVREDFALPKFKGLKWESSDNEIIRIEGDKAIVSKVEKDCEVQLIAKIGKNNRIFNLMVRADNDKTDIYRDYIYIKNELSYILNDLEELPKAGPNGSLYTYEFEDEKVHVKDYKVYKDENAERISTVLRIRIQKNDTTEDYFLKVLVLDKYEGYIMSYFNGELGEEKMRLAYSKDGLNWIKLDNSALDSEIGSNRIRDPFISRDKEGDFVVIATEGYDNPNIYYWKSKDLIRFDDNKLLKVAYENRDIKLTGHRAWAPEFSYDSIEDLYYIYYSDPKGNESDRMYYLTTPDFIDFCEVKTLVNTKFSSIDGTIKNINGKIYLFFKGEDGGDKRIYYVHSDNLQDLFTIDNIKALDDEQLLEGPFIIKRIDEAGYYLYVDSYANREFYVYSFKDLDNNEPVQLKKSSYLLPEDDVRHGCAVPVTRNELERIVSFYQE